MKFKLEEFKITPLSCVLILSMTIMFWLWNRSESRKKKLVGYVSEIRIHPVKSAKPLHHDEIEVSPLGVKHDRYCFQLLNVFCIITHFQCQKSRFNFIKKESLIHSYCAVISSLG